MPFSLASSDLTAVLRYTKLLVNLREGEFVEYTSDSYQLYALKKLRFRRLGQADECHAWNCYQSLNTLWNRKSMPKANLPAS